MTIDLNNLEIRNNADANRFEAEVDGTIAFAEYMIAGKNIIFTHTEVPPAFEGQGIAGKLARHALDFAVENGYKIQPLCPFMSGYVRKHTEYLPHTWGYRPKES